ncbi:hypothetical protein GCM10010389_09980 [Streptomyces echinoruber]|uniref:Uncharacterized protein n=1 Tax=Streptomyces echinoruber TaxID=68898 RepID=A0A918QVT5_9ACTN|nr:hypothetical protein GCM10010389_09980 [Streptomyces echinoruber]
MVIHWTSEKLASRSFWMAGLAMATMVPSRATIMTPTATVTRVIQGWPRSPLGGVEPDEPAAPPGPVASMAV